MGRIALEEQVTKIILKIGKPKALKWLKENFGVANFSKLNNAGLEKFIKDHA